MNCFRDRAPVEQGQGVILACCSAYAASITIHNINRTFVVLSVIPDPAEVAPFHAFPASVTDEGINGCDIFSLPHDLSDLHLHLKTVSHAVPVAVTESGYERSIECPDTVRVAFEIKMTEIVLCFFDSEYVEVTEIRQFSEYRGEVHSYTKTEPLFLRDCDSPAYTRKPHDRGEIIEQVPGIFYRDDLTKVGFLQMPGQKRIDQETIETGQTSLPEVCCLCIDFEAATEI